MHTRTRVDIRRKLTSVVRSVVPLLGLPYTVDKTGHTVINVYTYSHPHHGKRIQIMHMNLVHENPKGM